MEETPVTPESLAEPHGTRVDKGEGLADTAHLPGIIEALATLHSSAIITEEGIAHLFNRHVVSVKRAVERGELPPPCTLFGSRVWTAGVLTQHIERRLERAAQEAERDSKRIQSHGRG
jgi:hypothetical protein